MRLVTDPYEQRSLDDQLSYWAYAGLDTLGTRQVFDVLAGQLAGQDRVLYRCARAFESACMAMTLRGVRVDEGRRREAIARCEEEERDAIRALNDSDGLRAVWDVLGKRPSGDKCPDRPTGKHLWHPKGGDPKAQTCNGCGGTRLVGQGFNPHSSPQCAHLLYDLLGLKKRYSRKNSADGSRSVTTDDEALEALAVKYPEQAPLIDHILVARGLRKQLGALRTHLDADGRWRASFNVCAAETGRMSSSGSPYRTGANLQNIADKNRGIFVADPGLEIFYADLEQAESVVVANTSECSQDMVDHGSGNTHVGLAEQLFTQGEVPWELAGRDWDDPEIRQLMPWGEGSEGWPTGVVTRKQVCNKPLPWDPDHDYYHVAKIVRHGSNIGMTGNGVARQLHTSRAEGKRLREMYFARYPENEQRQIALRRMIRDSGVIVGPLGNTRRFLGRLWDDDVQRAGLAQVQQSTVAWMLNLAMLRIWDEMDSRLNISTPPRPSDPSRVWLLGQIHDAILGLRRVGDDDAMHRVKEIMETPVEINGRRVVIRAEVQVGKSWAHEELRKLKL